jgi:carboxypeptidase C (cathepsin A)
MIFIDHPAQVGFSYSKAISAYTASGSGGSDDIIQLPSDECPDYAQASGTCGTYSLPDVVDTANSTAGAAPSMWKTLQGFFGAFPQYSRHEFNFATESYGEYKEPSYRNHC